MQEDLPRFAREAAEAGLRHAFGIPGGGLTLDLIQELEAKGIAFHTTHSEASAALMAGSIGSRLGIPGTAISIKGPGFANLMAGVATAFLDSLPLIAVAEAYPPQWKSRPAHKYLDHGPVAQAFCKEAFHLTPDGPSYATLSAVALEEAPGPVLVQVSQPRASSVEIPLPSKGAVESNPRVAELVERAQRPLVIAGSLAVRSGLSPLLNSLSLPVFSTVSAKGVVDENLPHSAGIYTGAGGSISPEAALIPQADLIVGVGLRDAELLKTPPFPCPFINLDCIRLPSNRVGRSEVDDVGKAPRILEILQTKAWGLDEAAAARKKIALRLHRSEEPGGFFVTAQTILNEETRLVTDTGSFCTVAEHVWNAREPHHYAGSSQARSMGCAIPTAIGMCLADRRPTLAAVGDGGIGMFIADVKLAVKHNLPILFWLLSDGTYASVRMTRPQSSRVFNITAVTRPSWEGVMEALGLQALKPRSPGAFGEILRTWTRAPEPAYIETRFEPGPYGVMTEGLR